MATQLKPPPTQGDMRETATQLIGSYYFGTNCAAALVCALILATLPGVASGEGRGAIVAGLALFAGLCLWASQRSRAPSFPMAPSLCAVGLASLGFIGWISLLMHDGIRNPALSFLALVVCMISAMTGWRWGLALGLVAVLELAALALAETSGLLPAPVGATRWLPVLLFQCVVMICGWVGGSVISRVLTHYLRTAAQREQRFRGLLRIAADRYWEQDQKFRFTHVSETRDGGPGAERDSSAGWDIARMGLNDDQLDAHRADLEAHRPFNGLLVRRRNEQGRNRIHSISGEPKYDDAGVFTGYWGVTRDVTDELRAQRAVKATETRYRELFTRSPSPLFLHRRGVIFDANEAAARLFGFEQAAAMSGVDVLTLFPSPEARRRVTERLARLDALPVGEGLPVIDLQTRSVDGRFLSLQVTGVRVDAAGGPALLSIFFDVTARQATEAALRRSEAMLSHLFATSPDCIMLIDMGSGRFSLVNAAFTRLAGFTAEEVQGRTPAELGLWSDAASAAQLTTRLAREGVTSEQPAVLVSKSGVQVSMMLAAARFVMDHREYLVVNARDVTATERTRLEHAAILERASIGIAFTRDRVFVQANPYFERMFGWPEGGLRGQAGSVVWPDESEYNEYGRQAGPLLSTGQSFEVEMQLRRHDGGAFWCRLLAQAVDRSDPSRGGTIWIAEDITERRRLDQALAAARDAAEAASRAKSAFLANTSHEIRTPLNGLLGLARLAMQQDLPETRRQQYLNQIFDSAQSLSSIISDILDVSKIEAGKITLEDLPFGLRDTLQAVHHAYQSLADVKGLTLALSVAEGVPDTVRGDPVRVRQILSNFITNGLKFTDRGHVRIEASTTSQGWLRLAVVDTGPGVDTATQARLFTPFSQGDSSTTRRFGGTGLGLSICRELARLMGGEVGLQSTPGEGSTFWAELPLPAAEPAQVAASTEASDIDRLLGARVLMVEDNPVNMMIVVAMLEHWGVRVAQAHDGKMAVEAVHAANGQGDPFDAVLMDVQMPVMSGHEAARELRRHYASPRLPILALTAAALVSERDDAIRAGMNDFLTKPIDAPKLRESLARHLRARAAESTKA
ncbi:MAG: PAS domain S-box protein [Burkholderiaceae bacterium]